jgi:hypothetical protein
MGSGGVFERVGILEEKWEWEERPYTTRLRLAVSASGRVNAMHAKY